MEQTMSSYHHRVSASPAVPVHKSSHVILKPKPKIRIVHIHAPEIIKTDAAGFRELVQRLTGKPSRTGTAGGEGKGSRGGMQHEKQGSMHGGELGRETKEKKKEEVWMGESCDGFLCGIGDEEDEFLQGLCDCPLLQVIGGANFC